MFASDSDSWQNPRVLLTLLLVFLAGACAGALVVRVGIHKSLARAASPGRLSFERLKTDLELTPQQAETIKGILNDFSKFNDELNAQIEDTRATGKSKINAVLNPHQKELFKKICAEVFR